MHELGSNVFYDQSGTHGFMKSGNVVMRALSCIMSNVNWIAVSRYVWLRPTESNEPKFVGKL